jgi:muramidase (phage lysozyme)
VNRNRKAFLDMIAWSEIGPRLLAISDNGYNVVVGSTPERPILFDSYADHPRLLSRIVMRPNGGPERIVQSTAAGRYQILARYFDAYKRQLGLTDFSPASQDRIALQLIRECRALGDVDAGRIETAIRKCRSRWASLPGAGYGQTENSMEKLLNAYLAAGGTFGMEEALA